MRRRQVHLQALLASAPLLAGGSQHPAPQAEETIVFLGDSLTAGFGLAANNAYPALIQRRLDAEGRRARVVNAGVSGDTTAGGAARIDWIYRQKIDVLVVELGANDGLRGIPVDSTEQNLRAILDRAKHEKSRVLLVGMQLPDNYGPRYRKQFQAIFPRLAKAYGVAYLPFLLEGVAMRPELNQADGIHPNEKGAVRVSETVWKALEPMLERR